MTAVALALSLVLLPSLVAAKSLSGIVERIVVEAPDVTAEGAAATTYVRLRKGHHRAPVLLPDDDRLIDGAKMRVRGAYDKAANALVPETDGRGVKLLKPARPQATTGPLSMLVVHVNFPDTLSRRTRSDVAADFDYLPGWLATSSYEKLQLAVTTIDATVTVPLFPIRCDWNALMLAGIAAADPQIDFRRYPLVYLVVPIANAPDGCRGTGAASIGPMEVATRDGRVMLAVAVMREDDHLASIHEVGHMLGLNHAMRLRCPALGLPASLSGCESVEYGDVLDAMGSGWQGDFQLARKVQLGWVDPPPIVTAPGTYTIVPIQNDHGPRGLRLLRGATIVWLETRAPRGNDADALYGVFGADLQTVHLHAYLAPANIGGRQLYAQDSEMLATGPSRFGLRVGDALTIGAWTVQPQWRNPDGTTGVTIGVVPTPTPGPSPCMYPAGHPELCGE